MADPAAGPLVDHHPEDGVEVLVVRAAEIYRADLVERLGRRLRGAIEASRGTRFVLDLSGVTFLSSAALGMLINIHAHLAKLGYRFGVAGVRGEVASVFEYTRLRDVMPVFPTVADALKAMKA